MSSYTTKEVGDTSERKMYAYKIAYLSGVPSKKLTAKFPVDSTYARNNDWRENKLATKIRKIASIRNLILRNLEEFKTFQEDTDACSTFASNIKSIEIDDDKLNLNKLNEIYRDEKCHGVINYISLWFKNEASDTFEELDIPFPKEVIKAFFVFPGFTCEEQLQCFCDLRVQSASNNDGIIIPNGKVDKDRYEKIFSSDRSVYELISDRSGCIDVNDLYSNVKGVHWESDNRYPMFIKEDGVVQRDLNMAVSDANISVTDKITNKTLVDKTIHRGITRHEERVMVTKNTTNENEISVREVPTNRSPNNNVMPKAPSTSISFEIQKQQEAPLGYEPQCGIRRETKQIEIVNELQHKTEISAINDDILDFAETGKLIIAVDCDNVNFFEVLSLTTELLDRGVKDFTVSLYLDPKSRPLWNLFENYFQSTNISILKNHTKRIRDEKSSVDVALSADICQKVYKDGFDRIIILSSDCDYMALVDTVASPYVKFVIAFERSKVSNNYLRSLTDRSITTIENNIYSRDKKHDQDKMMTVIKYQLGYTVTCKGINDWNYQEFMDELVEIMDAYRIAYTNEKLKEAVSKMISKIHFKRAENHLELYVDDFLFKSAP